MTVTKQQQLEWLASKIVKWPAYGEKIPVSVDDAGNPKFYMPWDTMRVDCTREEWQRERDKMSKTPDVTISNQTSATITATQVGGSEMTITAQDNSWHERGELPPVGAICEMIDDKNTWLECEIVSHKNGFCIGWISSINAPFYTDDKSDFRPLRTEREKAIDEMMSLVMDGLMSHEMANELVIKLHDAGYCKVKP